MGVQHAAMSMRVLMDEVDPQQQLLLGEDVAGRAVRHDHVVLRDDHDAVDLLGRDREVVRREHHRAPRRLPLGQDVEQPHLAAGVEVVGGLVEKEDARLHRDHRPDRDPLLLTAGQRVRRPIEQLVEAERLRCLGDALAHLRLRQAELQRAERQLVEHARAKQLDVGLLEHEPDLRAELASEGGLLQGVFRERPAERLDGPLRREDEAVEHLQQRRLARAVGPDYRDVLSLVDRERDAAE